MLHTSVICLFCEDIREEKKNTDMIIGIMPDNVRIAQVPALFSRLVLYFRIQSPVDDPPPSVFIRVEKPGGEPIELGGMPLEDITKAVENARKDGAPYIGLILKLVLNNFPIESPGRFAAIARLANQAAKSGDASIATASKRSTWRSLSLVESILVHPGVRRVTASFCLGRTPIAVREVR